MGSSLFLWVLRAPTEKEASVQGTLFLGRGERNHQHAAFTMEYEKILSKRRHLSGYSLCAIFFMLGYCFSGGVDNYAEQNHNPTDQRRHSRIQTP